MTGDTLDRWPDYDEIESCFGLTCSDCRVSPIDHQIEQVRCFIEVQTLAEVLCMR